MLTGLRRYQQTGNLHFITFSCYRRLAYLGSASAREHGAQTTEPSRILNPTSDDADSVPGHLPINMTRMSCMAATLAVLSITATGRHICLAQCPDGETHSTNQKLAYLNRGVNRSDRTAVKCAVTLMDDLSRTQEPKAIPVILQLLDLKLTPEELQLQVGGGPQLYGGEYPAIGDLGNYGERAVPALLSTIAQSTPGTVSSQNAVRAFMAIENRNPSGGVRRLVQESWKAHGNAAAFLMEGAKFAATSLECSHQVQACQDALDARP